MEVEGAGWKLGWLVGWSVGRSARLRAADLVHEGHESMGFLFGPLDLEWEGEGTETIGRGTEMEYWAGMEPGSFLSRLLYLSPFLSCATDLVLGG